MSNLLSLSHSFKEVVEKYDLNGLDFQHISICKRRAWFHINRINYSHFDERMKRGTVLHETNAPRDISVNGLMGISPDRLDWKDKCVVEMKGSGGAQDAVSMQILFYTIMMTSSTDDEWKAKLGVIGSKKYKYISLSEPLVHELIDMAYVIGNLATQDKAPDVDEIPICSKCSYRFLCNLRYR